MDSSDQSATRPPIRIRGLPSEGASMAFNFIPCQGNPWGPTSPLRSLEREPTPSGPNHSYCIAGTLSIHGFLFRASPRFFVGVTFSNYPLMRGSVGRLYQFLRRCQPDSSCWLRNWIRTSAPRLMLPVTLFTKLSAVDRVGFEPTTQG